MARLKKGEFYVVAVNIPRGVYTADKYHVDELCSDENPGGVRWAAVYPFCTVYDDFRSLAAVRKFCKELDKEGYTGYTGRIYTD